MAGPRAGPGAALNRDGPLTGLLGGSFNPAHGGHRRISLFAMRALGLDEVWWLVSPGNPLKPKSDTAPLPARLASARGHARRAPIRVSAIEQALGTRFTIDTLRALKLRYPRRRFVWLMGSDNLAQFHRWRLWRALARTMPIAVIARPGYDGRAMAGPAMAWLRRYRRRALTGKDWAKGNGPTLLILRFDPDARSASAIRAASPDWHHSAGATPLRDALTRRQLTGTQP